MPVSLSIISPLRQKPVTLSRQELERLFPAVDSVVFIMAIPAADPSVETALEKITAELATPHLAILHYIEPEDLGRLMFEPPSRLAALVMKRGDWAAISRSLAKAWARHLPESEKKPEWERYGVIVPEQARRITPRKNSDLICHSFQHHPGVFYRFRYRRSMLTQLPPPLADFLANIPERCPHEVFTAPTNARASAQVLPHRVFHLKGVATDLLRHCAASLHYQPYKSRHENLERYFLEHDEHAIASEVPLWSIGEDPRFPTLTGHIDVLRYKVGRIEIWDYKPNARDEKMAAVQVQLYCEMLSRRTGLPLTAFIGGYFDETDAYAFEPAAFAFL